ncbi:MAG: hypothetical protein J6A25_00365 [Lachnospiraceae bacterium]|nr:hypothetical protein [Lachnospiraceae bacterium]
MALQKDMTIKRELPSLLTNNYIYISHMDEGYKYWRLPTDPDTIADSYPANYSSTPALGRSAPIFTYTGSGPRDVQITLNIHRDMMDDINMGNISPFKTITKDGKQEKDYFFKEGEDYIDSLIRALQSISVPKYTEANNIVEPPIVAVRFGNEIFVRGIVDSGVNVQYSKPILENDKYAQVQLSFNIKEIDPYDAPTIFKNGSFRGLVATMRKGMGFSLDE